MERRAAGSLGSLSEENFLRLAEAGVQSPEFTGLCAQLVAELRALCPLEEDVSPTSGPEDAETFQIELSGLLQELHCPYAALTTGDVTARLGSAHLCLQLLYFLSSELQAARLLSWKRPPSPRQGVGAGAARQELRLINQALGRPEPAPTCPIPQLLEDLKSKVAEALSALPAGHQEMAPLLRAPLTARGWGRGGGPRPGRGGAAQNLWLCSWLREALEGIRQALCAEYECRKRMMITRFNVTLQSFHWSERAKAQGSALLAAVSPLRQAESVASGVTLARLLATRADASRIVSTSSGRCRHRTSCAINKVLMGGVPDRGGRPNEIEPPMPTWEKRREGGAGQQRGRRGKKKK
ncbi:protein FAM98C [Terrapene carolina triunguis]|uniref:protein FAM98C n=1 Tax=Terrapene triunguis TaxID=2587831 RepID=UPI001156BD1C|nr:protein FAM98C [Terrapene carolina triunguis]